jgi:hypothetical protein
MTTKWQEFLKNRLNSKEYQKIINHPYIDKTKFLELRKKLENQDMSDIELDLDRPILPDGDI